MNDRTASVISLFASSSTLICCALPTLFIVLGAGASFASLITAFPLLISISYYKFHLSLIALLLILIGGYANYKTYYLPCPSDPELGKICLKTRQRSRYIYYSSVGLFIFATVFTYIVPRFT